MCMDGISFAVMSDEKIQQALANPQLDMVHSQVLLALYSMKAAGSLDDYQQVLPVYLSADAETCETILDALEQAGLIMRGRGTIELTHKIDAPEPDGSCGCHVHA
jgi:hypothetical protein